MDLDEVQVKLNRRTEESALKGGGGGTPHQEFSTPLRVEPDPPRGTPADYLVVFAGVPEEVSEEVKSGTFSDQDEVSGAVGQVSGR